MWKKEEQKRPVHQQNYPAAQIIRRREKDKVLEGFSVTLVESEKKKKEKLNIRITLERYSI